MTKAAPESQTMILHRALEDDGPSTVEELVRATGVPRKSASAALTRLVAAGVVTRLGRGAFATAEHARRVAGRVTLTDEAERLATTLAGAGVLAQLSGYDVLAPLANQLPQEWIHLVIAGRGSGEWAADELRAAGFLPVLEPGRAELDLLSAMENAGAVIVRERAVREGAGPVRGPEEAWVDLAAEWRAGYPIGASELGELLRGLQHLDVSWTRLARAAQRRGLPLQFDLRAGPVPLRVRPGASAPELGRMLSS